MHHIAVVHLDINKVGVATCKHRRVEFGVVVYRKRLQAAKLQQVKIQDIVIRQVQYLNIRTARQVEPIIGQLVVTGVYLLQIGLVCKLQHRHRVVVDVYFFDATIHGYGVTQQLAVHPCVGKPILLGIFIAFALAITPVHIN